MTTPEQARKMADALSIYKMPNYVRDALRDLARQVEELQADAKRYRWMRDIGDETWVPMGRRPGVRFSHEIDQAIDMAIAKAK